MFYFSGCVMKKIFFLSTVAILSTSFFLTGCSETIRSNTYEMQNLGRVNKINKVYITAIHKVNIDNEGDTENGAAAGALAGGIGGAILGDSASSTLFGALAGGLTGAAISQNDRYAPGISIDFRDKRGHLKNIIQAGHKHNFKIGQAREIITYLDDGEEYIKIQPNRHHHNYG